MHRCEDLFKGLCWWRNKFWHCCEIFSVQRSEFGFCYAFNSVTNTAGRKRIVSNLNLEVQCVRVHNIFIFFKQHELDYPWRTSSYGEWSGLKATVYVQNNNNSKKNHYGILVSSEHLHPDGNFHQWKSSDIRVTSSFSRIYFANEKKNATQEMNRLPHVTRQVVRV